MKIFIYLSLFLFIIFSVVLFIKRYNKEDNIYSSGIIPYKIRTPKKKTKLPEEISSVIFRLENSDRNNINRKYDEELSTIRRDFFGGKMRLLKIKVAVSKQKIENKMRLLKDIQEYNEIRLRTPVDKYHFSSDDENSEISSENSEISSDNLK